jgi:transposase, IS5 family
VTYAGGRTQQFSVRYKGYIGMNRWVGLGVIADNVINIGRAMEKQAAP